jgi:hypothetical protein
MVIMMVFFEYLEYLEHLEHLGKVVKAIKMVRFSPIEVDHLGEPWSFPVPSRAGEWRAKFEGGHQV